MGKIIFNSLRWFIKSYLILPKFQYDFRPSRSCTDNLVTFSNRIHVANLSGLLSLFTACVFIDITGAFDNIAPSALVETIRELGIPAKICKFIQNLIIERELFFVKNVHSVIP